MNEEKTSQRSENARLQRERRRGEILSAARHLFATRGYHATSIADIIEAADVARGTFYLYFDSKYAIFAELVDNVAASIRAGIRRVELTPGADSAEVQLLANASWLLSLPKNEPEMLRILLWQASGLDQEMDSKLASFYDEIFALMARSLEMGIALGLLRPCDTLIGARCIVGAIKELLLSLLLRGDLGEQQPERVAAKLLEFTVGGLLIRA